MSADTRRIKAAEVLENRYYKLPKWLIHDSRFKGLSGEAKILYSIMRDRNDLSIKNNWVDDDGNVYLIYTRENMMDDLERSKAPVIKMVNELKKYNLIDEVRQGCNKPNLIYVLTVDLDSQWKYRNDTSKSCDIVLPKVKILYPNETDISETDISETEEKSLKDLKSLPVVGERRNKPTTQQTFNAHTDEAYDNENSTLVKETLCLSLTNPQKLKVKSWDIEKLKRAIPLYITYGGQSFAYLERCYRKPIEAIKTPKKENNFTKMYQHNWDLEQLERKAAEYTLKTLHEQQEQEQKIAQEQEPKQEQQQELTGKVDRAALKALLDEILE